ncbi:M67 family metallopeptidase [Chthonomonas calidirosea]|uniref:M67 family metallopeptidase n=1 Tax=Chthonomonas calidirosea TaxID=454171 RepID=UPI0006EC65DB|nr:M67 family metallopeptidase [Chthonomonas calidirosea]CEK13789.1 predicted metal-dependent protease of the PAD1/JAB1 superfamily [Chthonomonas calidirosea]
MIRIPKCVEEAIRTHGAKDYPRECVGALLGQLDGEIRIVQEARPLPNTFDPSWEASLSGGAIESVPGQERRYLVSPNTMFQLLREERKTGIKVLGFYHSHPDHPALPSDFDREWASPWYIYCILSVRRGEPQELTAWQLNEAGDAFLEESIEIVSVHEEGRDNA